MPALHLMYIDKVTQQKVVAWIVSSREELNATFPALEDQIVCCTDSWAVRHCIVHEATGLVIPMVCDKYSCKYCGPRRVELWRSLIELAEPERFITLTRVGRTLVEVGRVATTLVQRLRRRKYRFEYCMTFEQHKNGYFHIHMLQKGDYIPQPLLSDCLRSATHGFSSVVDIRRCRPGTAGRLAAAEKKGEGSETYEGSWKLQEVAPLPRDDDGQVIEEAAHEQYRRLVAERVQETNTEPVKMSKGGKQVLAFMVLESLRLGDFDMTFEQVGDVTG